MKTLRLIFALIALLVVAPLAFAVEPDEMLKDPRLEARARELSAQLRCLVCQNESIDESDAPLAHDIRLMIRRRITEGESNAEIRAFLVSRYGDFILLKPPLKPETWLLWLSAPLTLALGGYAIYRSARRPAPPAARLTPEEEAKLAELQRESRS
ncbi:MAG: cytochrome c-type biogenesis protein [Roseiarcus sp.]